MRGKGEVKEGKNKKRKGKAKGRRGRGKGRGQEGNEGRWVAPSVAWFDDLVTLTRGHSSPTVVPVIFPCAAVLL